MKKCIQGIMISVFAFFVANSQAQCVYTVSAICNESVYHDTAIVCIGSPLKLMVQQFGCNMLFDDFNTGKLDSNVFIPNNSILFSNPCGSADLPASGLVAWMGNSASPREMKTKSLNFLNATTIEWDMKYGSNINLSNCEPPDGPSEGVYLEYSIDGGANWIQFPGVDQTPSGIYGSSNYVNGSGGYWMPVSGNFATGPYYSWNHYVSSLPSAAKTTHTMIRWIQAYASSSNSDHWGIDNVKIQNWPMVSVYWSNGSQLTSPPLVYPSADTNYSIIVIDSSFMPPLIYKDTIWVVMSNSISYSSFSVVPHICSMDTALITFTGNAPLSFNFQWDFGDFSHIISGNGAGPYKVSWYNPMPDSLMQNLSLIINPYTACASAKTSHTIAVYAIPEISFYLYPFPMAGCSPFNVNFFNETSPSNNLTTTWYFGDSTTSDSSSPSHIYQNPGLYDVTIICNLNNGCEASSFTAFDLIQVFEIPPSPIVVKHGDTLVTDYLMNNTYQWYLNDSVILGATDCFYVPQQIAYYFVTIQDYNGCVSQHSNRVLSIDRSDLLANDVIMPNPTNSYFSIKFNSIVNQVDILNTNGVLLKTYPSADNFNMYHIDELSGGMYFVKIHVDGIISMQKLIIY